MAHNYKRITQQFGVSYVYTILQFIFSPILIVILTRTLSVSDYGKYSILSSTIAVLSTILYLSLNAYIMTKLPGMKSLKKIRSLFSIISFEILFLSVSLLILSLPFIKNNLLSYLKLRGHTFEFQISLLIIFMNALFPLISSYLNANRKIEFQGFASFINQCLWIVFLILFFLIFKAVKLPIVFILWLLGSIISLLILIIYLKKDILVFFTKIKKISIRMIKEALAFSLPTVSVSVSSWVITAADRYMINYFKNSASVGLYTLSYSLVTIILGFSGIISYVLYPYISKAWHEKKDHHILFNAMLKYNMLIILPAMTGLFVLRKQIITLVSGPDYLPGSSVIAILVAYPLLISIASIYMSNFVLQGRTKLVGAIYIAGAIMNVVLNFVLIPPYGINGASIASIISYIFMFLVFYLLARKELHWNFSFLRIKNIIAASLIMGIILAIINPQVYITKIVSIILGALIYIALLFLLKVFVEKEYAIMKSILPKFLQKILNRYSFLMK